MDQNKTLLKFDDIDLLIYKFLKSPSNGERTEEEVENFLNNENKEISENRKKLFKEFDNIFSVNLFNAVLNNVNNSSNVKSIKIRKKLKRIIEFFMNDDYTFFIRSKRVLEICPIIGEILKNKINLFLKYQILVIIGFCLHHIKKNNQYYFGCHELEETLINDCELFSLDLNDKFNSIDKVLKMKIFCLRLSYLIVIDGKNEIYDINLENGMDFTHIIMDDINLAMDEWYNILYERNLPESNEEEYLKFEASYIYYNLERLDIKISYFYNNDVNMGDITSKKFNEFLRKTIQKLKIPIFDNVINKSKWDDELNKRMRTILLRTAICLFNIIIYIDRKNVLNKFTSFIRGVEEVIYMYSTHLKKNSFTTGVDQITDETNMLKLLEKTLKDLTSIENVFKNSSGIWKKFAKNI